MLIRKLGVFGPIWTTNLAKPRSYQHRIIIVSRGIMGVDVGVGGVGVGIITMGGITMVAVVVGIVVVVIIMVLVVQIVAVGMLVVIRGVGVNMQRRLGFTHLG